MLRTSLVLITLMLAAAGCDDDPSEPDIAEAEYDLAVSGAITETVHGKAYFGSDTDDEGNEVFALVLGQDTSMHFFVIAKSGASRPGVGTYEFEGLEGPGTGWNALYVVGEGEELDGVFVSVSGELTIEESSSSRITGSVEFDAEGFLGDGTEVEEVTVSGTFRAMRAGPGTMAEAAQRTAPALR